jgi:hypothetical protein
MSEEQFKAEKMYQISLSLAKSMLKKGLLTEEEFVMYNAILLEKYHPLLGTLFLT